MLINFFLQPFQNLYMQKSLAELILISLLTGLIGSFLVLKNFGFISEGLSHGVYPGIVSSFILGVNNLIGAIVVGVLAVIGITLTSRNKKISANNSIIIFFTSLFALGVIMSNVFKVTINIEDFFIGNIEAVTGLDLVITLIFTVAIAFLVFFLYKELVISAFDRSFAKSVGIQVDLLDLIFNILVALVVVISLKAVGNVLVIAVLIVPALTARLLTKRISQMIITATIISLLSSIAGLYISYYLNIATGSTIVLIIAFIFFGVNFITEMKSKR